MESEWRSRHDRLVAELRNLRSAAVTLTGSTADSELKRNVMSWEAAPNCLQRTFVDSRLDAGFEGLQSLSAHLQSPTEGRSRSENPGGAVHGNGVLAYSISKQDATSQLPFQNPNSHTSEVEDLREQLRHALKAVEARNDDVWKLRRELQQQKKQIEENSKQMKAQIVELQSGASRSSSSSQFDGQRTSPRMQGPLRRAAPPPQTFQNRSPRAQGPLRRAGSSPSKSRLESPRISRSKVESPTSRSRVESPAARSRVESPTSRSKVESPTSTSKIESPTSKSAIESPTSRSSIESPRSKPMITSPTSRSKTETLAHELNQQPGDSRSGHQSSGSVSLSTATTAAAVAAAAFEGMPSLADADNKSGCPANHTLCGKSLNPGSPPPRASQRLQSNLSRSVSSRAGSQGRAFSNRLRPTAPGAVSPFRRSSSTQQLVGAPIDQPRKSVIARLSTKPVTVVTAMSEARAPSLKVSPSLKKLHVS